MNTYGYARVSGNDQNLARQFDAFEKFGIEKENIFADKKSGKDFERENYLRLIKILKNGDLLVILSLDRLGRNYDQILDEWERITRRICADVLVLDMPLLDTRAKADTLVGRFIADIVLQVLSFVAENERQNIHARQQEGIRLAKLRGIKFGRPEKQYSEEFIRVMRAYRKKEISLSGALAVLNIGRSAFFKHLHRLEQRGVL